MTEQDLLKISYDALSKRSKEMQKFARDNVPLKQSKDYYCGYRDSLYIIYNILKDDFAKESTASNADDKFNALYNLYMVITEKIDSLCAQSNILEYEYFGDFEKEIYVN